MDENNAVEIRQPMPLTTFKEVASFGVALARSGMFGLKSDEEGAVLAMYCHSTGTTPFDFKRKFHLIDKNLSMRADAMLADFRVKCHGEHDVVERTPDRACIRLYNDGNEEGLEFELTWEEALKEPFVYQKDGKTLKKNWASPRGRMQMLWCRVVSDGVRTVAPEVVAGVYTPEEVQDFKNSPESAPIDITAQVEAANEPPPKAEPEQVKEEPKPEVPDDIPERIIEDAIVIIKDKGVASGSYIRKRLHISTAKIAKILTILEERGIVGPSDGKNPREFLGIAEETSSEATESPEPPAAAKGPEEEEKQAESPTVQAPEPDGKPLELKLSAVFMEDGRLDPNYMPDGKYVGNPWHRFSDAQLTAIPDIPNVPAISQAHKDAIRDEVKRREAAKNQ